MSKLEELQKPNASIDVSIQDIGFTFNYPTSGQTIDIAVLKAKLSENQYSHLAFQNSTEAQFALKLIDAFAFLTIMIPDLKTRLAKSLYDLKAEESLELIHLYENNIQPWLDQWTEFLNNRIAELKGEASTKRSLV